MGEAASRTGQTESKTSKPNIQTDRHIDTETIRSQQSQARATAICTAAFVLRNNPVYEDYTDYKPNSLPTEFEHNGKAYKRYLPGKVLDYFNDEFDYQELINWQDLQNLAMAYFTLIASPYEVTSGGGGGGSQSDLKWGRDPEEDEIEFARRCAREASHRLGIQKKSGIKRK